MKPIPCQAAPKRVLFINSYHKGYGWSDKLVETISDYLEKEFPGVEIFVEYMDTKRFGFERYNVAFLELLYAKYSIEKPDLIIASDDNAFQFVLKYHKLIFGKTPIVFLGVNKFSDEMIRGKEDYITGVIQFAEVEETIKVALRLHPHARTVAVLADATPTGQGYMEQVKEVESGFQGLEFLYINGKEYTTYEMLRIVEALPYDSVLLFCIWVRDKSGNYTPWPVLYPEITSRSPVPIYGIVDYMLDYGVIGGKVQSPVHHGLEAARMAARILKGEDVANIPVQKGSTNVFMFDFASLERWGIPDEMLPKGSIIVNKRISLYEQHKEWFIGGLIVCFVLFSIIVALWANIQARKRAEERIRESEERYRSIFENSRDAISIIARDGEIIDTNPAWRQLFGYSKQELASIRAPALWQWPEKREEWIYEVETHGFVEDYPFTARTKQGKSRLCLITSAKSRLKDGRNVFHSIVRDITEKVQMEQALRESQEKFSKAFDSSPDPMCITTLEAGVYVEVNEAFCKLTGWNKAEIIGKTALELGLYHNPSEREKGKQLLIEQGTVKDYEVSLISREGREYYLLWSAEMVEISGENCILSVLKDITERKIIEERLREERERFISLVENAPIGVSLFRANGTFAYLNPTFVEIFGYTLEDIPDRKTWLRKAFPEEEERHRVVAEWKEAIKKLERGEVFPYTFMVTTKSGEKKVIKFRVVQLASGDYLVTYEDVTDVEMLQRQILHAQKMESIGTLAGGVAHDFNNSLQAILGFTQLLLMEKSADDPEFEKLKKIEQTALKSRELVKQILTFSRKVESKRRPLDLNQEIREIEKLLYRTLPKMIKINLHLAKELKKIDADPVQLEQIIMNIAVNARDAMPKGGILTIETANATLSEQYARSHLGAVAGEYVLLSISDTGEGMDKKTLDRIFEPFFTTKGVGKGTGLGLAMVYGIVKDHGGYITCYSEKAKGTTFKIYFPALTTKGVEEQQPHPPSTKTVAEKKSLAQKNGRLVMVVDDEKNILDVATHILNSAGYEVIKASSGSEALEIYKENFNQISLVILDYVMPEMDGTECMKRILEINPQANILIASGFAGEHPWRKLVEEGAKGFVPKPFDMKELLEKVERILGSEASG